MVLDDKPGNSVNETGERMNGGAVMEDKSPLKEAILTALILAYAIRVSRQKHLRLDKGHPASALVGRNSLDDTCFIDSCPSIAMRLGLRTSPASLGVSVMIS
jgi:hypothetical protein